MAKPTPPAAPTPVKRSMVASATRFAKGALDKPTQANWQRECYRHYSICGEARYAAQFIGNALSRADIYVAIKTPEGGEERVTKGPAVNLMNTLFAGINGKPQMLKSLGVHLTVAGEAYLVGRVPIADEGESADEIFEVVAPTEITTHGEKWAIKYDGRDSIPLSDDDVVIRIWNPHPSNRMQADSPFRSLLSVLNEIEDFTKHTYAQIRSRLAGAGILFVPQGMSFPPPPDQDGEQQEIANEADAFMMTLASAMMAAKGDLESPASMVPITVAAPDDVIDKARLMTFWSELDSQAMEMRSDAIRRFALGMDLPPEQVTGMGGGSGSGDGSGSLNHWGSAQVEEQTIRMHVEPMLETVAQALTVSYLRPLLGVSTPEHLSYDTSSLRVRPARGREAIELWDRGLLNDAIVLRENGFDPTEDAPDEDEMRLWLLRKIATSVTTPEQALAALESLGVPLRIEAPAGSEGVETPQPRSLEGHPDTGSRPRRRRGARRPSYAEDDALVAACDALVWRAVEKAGNRILNDGKRGRDKVRGANAFEAHVAHPIEQDPDFLLDGAFACAPQVLDDLADHEDLTPLLHQYCLTLFATQAPHSKDRLRSYLESVDVGD